jgi:hypothetical protein
MTKKTNLAEALGQFSTQPARAVGSAAVAEKPAAKGRGGASPLPPSRQGKKTVAGFFDTAVSTQLKQIGLDRNLTVQDLLTEAINDLFKKYKKPPIA